METKRKLQLGAAAVIANGLLALAAMQPVPAIAGACDVYDTVFCSVNFTCPTVDHCTPRAGCSVQEQCVSFGCSWMSPPRALISCDYS